MYKIVFKGMPGLKSGYGKATTYFAKCFYKSKLDVNFLFNPVAHYQLRIKSKVEAEHKEFKKMKMHSNQKYDIMFEVGTPKGVGKKIARYNILYFYWETDTIPSSWVKKIHEYDEIWVPCEENLKSLKKISFPGAIKVFPTPSFNDASFEEFYIPHKNKKGYAVADDVFKFYYIFQWHYRKGYDLLIKAYLEAFSSEDNVILILKTNKIKGNDQDFINKIKEEIYSYKRKYLNSPEIYIVPKIISNNQISFLHKMSDVYVCPYRGEGWGMPIVQAAKNNNAIITTKFGGFPEMLNEDSALFLDHKLIQVKNMSWSGNLYTADQKWAEPTHKSLVKSLKYAYHNKDKMAQIGKNAGKIAESISIENISNELFNELSSKRFII